MPDTSLTDAVAEFERRLPGWWFRLGRHLYYTEVHCGPCADGPDDAMLEGRAALTYYASGETLAEALADAMRQGLAAREAWLAKSEARP